MMWCVMLLKQKPHTQTEARSRAPEKQPRNANGGIVEQQREHLPSSLSLAVV